MFFLGLPLAHQRCHGQPRWTESVGPRDLPQYGGKLWPVKSWASSTTQRRIEWFPICALTVNLKCFLAELLCKVKMGKKAKSLFQKPASERVLGHWTLEVSHHLTNTKSTFEMLSNKLHFKTETNKHSIKIKVNCSHPKNLFNYEDAFSSSITNCMISISPLPSGSLRPSQLP